MKNSYNPSTQIATNIEPVSRPLPLNKTTFVQRNCRVFQARESWDRLFDEAYRADVEIHTYSHDGVIYGHASILVSSIIHVKANGHNS